MAPYSIHRSSPIHRHLGKSESTAQSHLLPLRSSSLSQDRWVVLSHVYKGSEMRLFYRTRNEATGHIDSFLPWHRHKQASFPLQMQVKNIFVFSLVDNDSKGRHSLVLCFFSIPVPYQVSNESKVGLLSSARSWWLLLAQFQFTSDSSSFLLAEMYYL